jgi:hypothetical protein
MLFGQPLVFIPLHRYSTLLMYNFYRAGNNFCYPLYVKTVDLLINGITLIFSFKMSTYRSVSVLVSVPMLLTVHIHGHAQYEHLRI